MFKRTKQRVKELDEDTSPTLPTSVSWPLIHPKRYPPTPHVGSASRKPAVWERQRKILASIVIAMCFILATCIFHRGNSTADLIPQPLRETNSTSTSSIVRGWQPPLVDRYILRKLDRLNEEDLGEEDWEQLREEGFLSNFSTVPVVDSIPEISKKVHVSSSTSTSQHTERLFPIGTKFLLPSWIGEQESKARLHLVQLAHLGMRINRTLVLPNLATGRMGTCMKSGFEVYYDIQTLGNAISFASFTDHLSSIPERLTGSIVSLDTKAPVKSVIALDSLLGENIRVSVDQFGDPSKARHNNCLRDKAPGLQFRAYSPVWVTPATSQWNKSPESHNIAADLVSILASPSLFSAISRSREVVTEPTHTMADVIVMEWNLRHPIFLGLEGTSLPYARGWIDLAERLADSMSPFVGIHWRMETIHPSVLLSYVEELLQTLADLLQQHRDISTVYFATDYPIADEQKPRSGTFGEVHVEQRQAIHRFWGAFESARELSNHTLVHLEDLVGDGHMEWENLEGAPAHPEDWDLGSFGIVDKLVLMKSPMFISAGATCGKTSSYTRQIIEARSSSGAIGLRNIVDYFGLPDSIPVPTP